MTGCTLAGVDRAAVADRVWRREGVWAAGSPPDTTTDVSWLQLGTWYCDLRRPAGLAATGGPLPELTREQLLALTEQEAFAGRLRQDGDVWTWTRVVDLHPPAALPDAGRLALDGDVLVETGVGREYVERWADDTPPARTPRLELELRGEDGRAGFLLRLGDHFGYVRDRAAPLPPGSALRDLVADSDLVTARQLLDLEVSLGVVADGDWRITSSTLPARVGCRLQPRRERGTSLTVADLSVAGRPVRRRWLTDPTHP